MQFPVAIDHHSNPTLLKQLWTRVLLGKTVSIASTLYLPKIVIKKELVLELRAKALAARPGDSDTLWVCGSQRHDASATGAEGTLVSGGDIMFDTLGRDQSPRSHGVSMRVTLSQKPLDVGRGGQIVASPFQPSHYRELMTDCEQCSRQRPGDLLQLHSFIHFPGGPGGQSDDQHNDESAFDVSILAIFPTLCLRLRPLQSLRLFASPLTDVLCEATQVAREPAAGYLTIDRARYALVLIFTATSPLLTFDDCCACRRLIPLLHSDAVVGEWPIIGVWLRGVQLEGTAETGFRGLENRYVDAAVTWLHQWLYATAHGLSTVVCVCVCFRT